MKTICTYIRATLKPSSITNSREAPLRVKMADHDARERHLPSHNDHMLLLRETLAPFVDPDEFFNILAESQIWFFPAMCSANIPSPRLGLCDITPLLTTQHWCWGIANAGLTAAALGANTLSSLFHDRSRGLPDPTYSPKCQCRHPRHGPDRCLHRFVVGRKHRS